MLGQAVTIGLVPKILEATLFQRLSGDITIVPPFKVSMYTNIISNPTWETIKQFMEVHHTPPSHPSPLTP
jgi:hypothetical protein